MERNWIREIAGNSTLVRVSATLLDSFWEALRQGVIVRADEVQLRETLYQELLSKPACDIIQVLRSGESSRPLDQQSCEAQHRFAMWRGFKEAFEHAAQLFAGYPASCPDFRNGFPFTSLPLNVQNRLIGFLAPVSETSSIMVVDAWPNPRLTVGQTKYLLEDEAGRRHETTYRVFSRSGTGVFPFLSSNAHRRYVRSLQYADGINFPGSPESVCAFMHDRMANLDLMKKIELNYHFRHTTLPSGLSLTSTKPGSWRKLSNMLVHDCIGLKNVNLVVSKLFWDNIRWNTHSPNHNATAEQLIRLPRRSSRETGIPSAEEEDRPCGFLEKLGRLSNEQHLLKFSINGADTEDKKQFKRAVKLRLYHCMGTRPAIAEAKGCRCQTKVLSNCCAWNPSEDN